MYVVSINFSLGGPKRSQNLEWFCSFLQYFLPFQYPIDTYLYWGQTKQNIFEHYSDSKSKTIYHKRFSVLLFIKGHYSILKFYISVPDE